MKLSTTDVEYARQIIHMGKVNNATEALKTLQDITNTPFSSCWNLFLLPGQLLPLSCDYIDIYMLFHHASFSPSVITFILMLRYVLTIAY